MKTLTSAIQWSAVAIAAFIGVMAFTVGSVPYIA